MKPIETINGVLQRNIKVLKGDDFVYSKENCVHFRIDSEEICVNLPFDIQQILISNQQAVLLIGHKIFALFKNVYDSPSSPTVRKLQATNIHNEFILLADFTNYYPLEMECGIYNWSTDTIIWNHKVGGSGEFTNNHYLRRNFENRIEKIDIPTGNILTEVNHNLGTDAQGRNLNFKQFLGESNSKLWFSSESGNLYSLNMRNLEIVDTIVHVHPLEHSLLSSATNSIVGLRQNNVWTINTETGDISQQTLDDINLKSGWPIIEYLSGSTAVLMDKSESRIYVLNVVNNSVADWYQLDKETRELPMKIEATDSKILLINSRNQLIIFDRYQ